MNKELVTPDRLLGALMLCPHCDKMLPVVKVSNDVHEGTDPSGKPNTYFIIMLSDGGTARFWQEEF